MENLPQQNSKKRSPMIWVGILCLAIGALAFFSVFSPGHKDISALFVYPIAIGASLIGLILLAGGLQASNSGKGLKISLWQGALIIVVAFIVIFYFALR